MSHLPKLYNGWFCPFAQRAWIALVHKGVEFEYIEQDPYNKSPEWLAINPVGLVPAIVHNGKTVRESSICIEYVDEAWPEGPRIFPRDPYERAHQRMWSDHVTKRVIPHFYAMLLRQTAEEQEQAEEDLLRELQTLTNAADPHGPFFAGNDLSMVDIMIAPFLVRFEVLNHFREFEVPDDMRYDRLRQWHEAVINHASVKATLPDMDRLIESYQRYAENTTNSLVAQASRQNKALP